jgi:hypothetical protein
MNKYFGTFLKNCGRNLLKMLIKIVCSKIVGTFFNKCWQHFQKNVREKMVATLRKILANFRKILTRKKLATLPKNVGNTSKKC